MARMTRTQVSLEEKQYLFVKKEAARQGKSLSAIIRDLIEGRMTAQVSDVPASATSSGSSRAAASRGSITITTCMGGQNDQPNQTRDHAGPIVTVF